jgi:hypothetical protein
VEAASSDKMLASFMQITIKHLKFSVAKTASDLNVKTT